MDTVIKALGISAGVEALQGDEMWKVQTFVMALLRPVGNCHKGTTTETPGLIGGK